MLSDKFKTIKLKINLLLIAIAVVLLTFTNTNKQIDASFSGLVQSLSPTDRCDTNIVIIEITNNDIEKLGGWPLKRSYYALLINSLKNVKPKKIGLGIFLSGHSAFQTTYNDLILNEISSSGNVVLSSLISGLKSDRNKFSADSILYPQLKELDKNISTGHLNYFDKNGFSVPLKIEVNGSVENCFALELLDKNGAYSEKLIKTNLNKDWHNYQRISLLEYFNSFKGNSSKLNQLKNKFVIIGVTDPSTAKFITVDAYNKVPGVAFHAMVLDNLLNSNFWNLNYYNISLYIFIFSLLILILVKEEIYPHILLISFLLFVIIAFLFSNSFYIELAYSFYIVPFLFLLVGELYFFFNSQKSLLEAHINEAELLKLALKTKEKELGELTSLPNPNKILVEKIEKLKNQIEKLKTGADENEPSPVSDNDNPKQFEGIIYRSNKIEKLIEIVKKVAPQTATVTIIGESGSGKEEFAKAIHNLSNRKDGRFIPLNCAAISENLLESELFGHVKGAFTGAVDDKIGMFEAAENGTIFLDEIGETTEAFQVKMLRVLQSGEIQKIGSTETIKTNARIVAATNKNLENLVKQGEFREDLYYRLNVITIKVPPLRERPEDIKPLANHFAKGVKIAKGVISQLENHNWPGNVRELQSIIKRASIFCDADKRNIILLCDLPTELIKSTKLNIEELILESLREKSFSHSAINETAKELGGLNRIVISENFKGTIFRTLVNNNFELDTTAMNIANTNNQEVIDKVKNKIEQYLNNIKKDVDKFSDYKFEVVKEKISTKYKNLPKHYHIYLDEVIKQFLG